MGCPNKSFSDANTDPFGDGSLKAKFTFNNILSNTFNWVDTFSEAGTSFTDGHLGKALSVNDPNMSETTQGHGFVGEQSLSFSLWIKAQAYPTGGGVVGIFAFGGVGQRYNVTISLNSSATGTSFVAEQHKGATYDSLNSSKVLGWHHIVYTYDISTQRSKWYLDKGLIAINTLQMKWLDKPFEIDAGYGVAGATTPVEVDQLMTFTRVLSNIEVNALFDMYSSTTGTSCIEATSNLQGTGTAVTDTPSPEATINVTSNLQGTGTSVLAKPEAIINVTSNLQSTGTIAQVGEILLQGQGIFNLSGEAINPKLGIITLTSSSKVTTSQSIFFKMVTELYGSIFLQGQSNVTIVGDYYGATTGVVNIVSQSTISSIGSAFNPIYGEAQFLGYGNLSIAGIIAEMTLSQRCARLEVEVTELELKLSEAPEGTDFLESKDIENFFTDREREILYGI